MQYHCPTNVRATEPDFPIKYNELSRYRGQEVVSLIFRRGVHCVHEGPARTDMLARADFVDKQALDDPFRIAPQSNRLAIRYGHDGAGIANRRSATVIAWAASGAHASAPMRLQSSGAMLKG
jgi:hypothetical protein